MVVGAKQMVVGAKQMVVGAKQIVVRAKQIVVWESRWGLGESRWSVGLSRLARNQGCGLCALLGGWIFFVGIKKGIDCLLCAEKAVHHTFGGYEGADFIV
jgi:hypothetical protein